MDNNQKLDEVISKNLDSLNELDPSDEGYSDMVNNCRELMKLSNASRELDVKDQQAADHAELEYEKLKEQKKERYFKYGTTIATFVAGIIASTQWQKMGYKFEEVGTIASKTFGNVLSNTKSFLKKQLQMRGSMFTQALSFCAKFATGIMKRRVIAMINLYNIIGAILLVLAIVTVFVTDMLDLGILAFIAGSVLIQVRIEKTEEEA